MCGIVGFASKNRISDLNCLIDSRDTMTHRGPDDAGIWWSEDRRIGLAQRRLSIIDLSPSGHQPMINISGELVIVLNGEIYNFQDLRKQLQTHGYQFFSSSDTEVILASYHFWGLDCLQHFNGMFAFALFDSRKNQLLIARDRAGEKPLFYTLDNGLLTFASELKAIMANPTFKREIDKESLDCYFSIGYNTGDRCMLKGVNKLPAAHMMLFDLKTGEAKISQYWKLPEFYPINIKQNINEELSLLDELEQLLSDSVKRQLIADVPIGILLSGGVDSSLVTAMAARHVSRVKTFTIRFPDHEKYDETEHARLVANHFGTNHTELIAEPSTVDLLPKLARQFDDPMVDSSMIPTFLVSQLIRKECSVALGGDGGDELFGGYNYYDRIIRLEKSLKYIPSILTKMVAQSAESLLPIGFKGRNWLQFLDVDLKNSLPNTSSLFDKKSRNQLLEIRNILPLTAEKNRSLRIPSTFDLVQRATRMDFENYLVEDILVKVDRASMLNSLEIRAPLLDYRIIEFAFGKVPSDLKANENGRKILLKMLCSRVLPKEFDKHRKQGFSIPLASWLKEGPWLDFMRDVLLDSSNSLFNQKFISKLIEGQKHGRSNSERLFALTMFELWRREYNISI